MGHIRLGRLPKTRTWAEVFKALNAAAAEPDDLARSIAAAAHDRLFSATYESPVTHSFWLLARLATAARSDSFELELGRLGINADANTPAVVFIRRVGEAVRAATKTGQWSVFADTAEASLRKVLTDNIVTKSETLFGCGLPEVRNALREMSTPKRFGEAARDYFANFLGKTITFVADKEMSNHVGPRSNIRTPAAASAFQQALETHCKESAKIAEEFASGWYSKHNWQTGGEISKDEAFGFTAYALEKLSMELRGSENE